MRLKSKKFYRWGALYLVMAAFALMTQAQTSAGDVTGAATAATTTATSAVNANLKTAIRRVDFKNNFTYTPYCTETPLRVRKGEYTRNKDDDKVFFTVQSLAYGDLTGDGIEEAGVETVCNTGGTGNFSHAFIYTLRGGKAVLLTDLPGGDRASGGIYALSVKNGLLVAEFYAVSDEGGACCPEFIDTETYRFKGGKLIKVGKTARRKYVEEP